MTTDLERRLGQLGARLDIDDVDVRTEVVARIAEPPTRHDRPDRRAGHWLTAAAIVVLLVAATVVAVPGARRTVARWFGFDAATIELRGDLVVPDTADPIDLLGPGVSEIVATDDGDVLVSQIDGTLDGGLIAKTVGSGTNVFEVDVAGRTGVWISGRPHEVVYTSADGSIVAERVAGNTLLWQVGPVLHRLEGFDDVAAAIEYASTVDTG